MLAGGNTFVNEFLNFCGLKNISAVASDLKFAMGGGTGSPSLVIDKLAVAGE